jgi:two-component system, NarL family, sensor histidine kinase UhpB
MWKKLSLRARLSLPMVAMVVVALGLGGVALQIVSPEQFEYENAQSVRAAKAVADGLNAALAVSSNPQAVLDAFAQSLRNTDIEFRRADAVPAEPRASVPEAAVPRWFVALLDIPSIARAYPVTVGNDRVGDVVFSPDLSADVFEKWMGFLGIVLSGSTLMLLAAASAYFTTGSAIRPLGELQAGLTRLRAGDYETMIASEGPPEIRRSCVAANQLALTLKGLNQDNRDLLRRLVSVQDDERRELARELHDELGPLLFAIRANATALAEASPGQPPQPAREILQAAEALQQANRRILEGLSPLYAQDLGLEQSIQTLLRNAQAQAPAIRLTASIDSRLNGIDGLLSQTTYRVIQEAVTNVLRHARAGAMNVRAGIADKDIAIEISDDGVGFATENGFGRGLTGMNERVRALNGSFELVRDQGRTVVRCHLPLAHGASD